MKQVPLQRKLFQVDRNVEMLWLGCHILAKGHHADVKVYASLGKGKEGQDALKNVKYVLRTKRIP